MSSLKISVILLYLIGLTSLTTIAQDQSETPLSYDCPNTTTFPGNSTYQANLNLVLSSLTSNATNSLGFYNASAGRDPDDVYGLFLCRGDASTDTCRQCVTVATRGVTQLCPVEKVAVLFYDLCLLLYSNQSTFNDVYPNIVYMWNPQNVTGNQTSFNDLVGATMTEMAAIASAGAKKFAVKEKNVTAFQTLYALAQCLPDLSNLRCSQCLVGLIGQLPNCCDGKQGGRVLTPNCNIRYELYPFYNATAVSPPPPPPLSRSPPPPPPPPSASVSRPKGGSRKKVVVVVAVGVPIVVAIVLFFIGYCFLSRRRKEQNNIVQEDNVGNEITNAESLQYDFGTIQAATSNFSDDNKLGEGGFGLVYKGTLPNGQEIAVKRLSRTSGQGAKEFKNEVVLVANLQHRNLVRLLGFCLEGEEKILVYEFVPNKSLDYVLFDPEKQGQLDWSRRYKIIGGIARGLLYLHQDSRLRIIHRDLKASNILLDGDMNPKISDFGTARIFGVDQTQANTNRIIGTYGYMSPEYAMHGQFSVKSDAYSFGVLLLEIITGRKNSSFYQTDGAVDLVSYVWKHWIDETPLQVLDPTLLNSYSRNEVMRCIHIGILCVQEDPAERPPMATVVLMLNSYSVTLPLPKQPAFFVHSRSELNTWMKGLESVSEKSKSKSVPLSVDEESITEIYPR